MWMEQLRKGRDRINRDLSHAIDKSVLFADFHSDARQECRNRAIVDWLNAYHRTATLFPSLYAGHSEWWPVRTARSPNHSRISLRSVHRMFLFVLWHSLAPQVDHRLKQEKKKKFNLKFKEGKVFCLRLQNWDQSREKKKWIATIFPTRWLRRKQNFIFSANPFVDEQSSF